MLAILRRCLSRHCSNPPLGDLAMTFHLHTEDRPNLPLLVRQFFPAFTLTPGTGYWADQSEPTCTIEIETEDTGKIGRLARAIKATNAQQAVLVETYPTRKELI